MSATLPMLDVRPSEQYRCRHWADSVNIPLEELPTRTHELPAKGTHLRVGDVDAQRLQQAVHWLEQRGYEVEGIELACELHQSNDASEKPPRRPGDPECSLGSHQGEGVAVFRYPLFQDLYALRPSPGLAAGGSATLSHGERGLSAAPIHPSTSSHPPAWHRPRLWQPSPFLVRAFEHVYQHDAAFTRQKGRVLDIACGSGRDMVWLAMQGFEVEGIDVLPDALAKAQDLAQRNQVTIQTRVQNVRRNLELSVQHYQLIIMLRFMHQPLLPMIEAALQPGGYFIGEVFADHSSPASQAPQLDGNDWSNLFQGLQPVMQHTYALSDGRVMNGWIGRKPL